MSDSNYYDALFDRLSRRGMPCEPATLEVAEAYLDGRPAAQRGRNTAREDRDRLFWTSRTVDGCTPDSWAAEAMVLALTRYMGQEEVSIDGLLTRVAQIAPDTLLRAVRYSGLVLNRHSPRSTELRAAAAGNAGLMELCSILDVFDGAYRERKALLETLKTSLSPLSAFELLLFASLYAFERLVPRDLHSAPSESPDAQPQTAWDAIGDLLAWKLGSNAEADRALKEEAIASFIGRHLKPILFEAHGAGRDEALRTLANVARLIEAQIELNEFVARSADAFSYADEVRFERHGNSLEIVEVDEAPHSAWNRENHKLAGLHGYWFCRAVESFVASDVARARMGRPENEDANRLAWIRALQGKLRLQEVYGISETVTADTGAKTPVFQALLALNLMSQFFLRDFLGVFAHAAAAEGGWQLALRRLAIGGLLNGNQLRLPLTWSHRDAKIRNITGWTVTPQSPNGSEQMAAAILDFWTCDVSSAAKSERGAGAIEPHLFERPILKFGNQLIQLPWVVGMQNTSAAAINNLRRLGARRNQAREETQRIESNLADLLRKRGFAVLLNWLPPPASGAGEVDVIAARDRHLFVLEIKSTYLRKSQRAAWVHATTTLRKAGRQLRNKIGVVKDAIADGSLRDSLGLHPAEELAGCHCWIVDTSIERDHHRFNGFLKLSLEELVIALRDDADLLAEGQRLMSGRTAEEQTLETDGSVAPPTLYPEGFHAGRLIEVIETEAVWAALE